MVIKRIAVERASWLFAADRRPGDAEGLEGSARTQFERRIDLGARSSSPPARFALQNDAAERLIC